MIISHLNRYHFHRRKDQAQCPTYPVHQLQSLVAQKPPRSHKKTCPRPARDCVSSPLHFDHLCFATALRCQGSICIIGACRAFTVSPTEFCFLVVSVSTATGASPAFGSSTVRSQPSITPGFHNRLTRPTITARGCSPFLDCSPLCCHHLFRFSYIICRVILRTQTTVNLPTGIVWNWFTSPISTLISQSFIARIAS